MTRNHVDAPDLPGYVDLFEELKSRIGAAQLRAALAVNGELVILYWQIGRRILEMQAEQGWGAKVIDRLSTDLRRAFPATSGFSSRSLKYMRAFAEANPDPSIVQEVLAQLTWYHNMALLDKIKSADARLWYAHQAIRNGWSRNVLVHQIESELHKRAGRATTNFERTLPPAESDLACEIVKDPYHFDFLNLGPEVRERDLEHALLDHLRDFLLELGVGFAFLGSQYRLQVGGQEYRVDLLFYHVRLRCYVVIELKLGAFQPEFAGKMNFYLAAIDEQLRHPEDRPSIGLILCKERNRVVVEYSLRSIDRPIGVSEYRLTGRLPEDLRGSLPTPDELIREMDQFRAVESAE